MPDINIVRSHVEDLKSVLGSASIIEKRAFLKSFVKDMQVGDGSITIHYWLPMPPKNESDERIEVLPFIKHGDPRTPFRSST